MSFYSYPTSVSIDGVTPPTPTNFSNIGVTAEQAIKVGAGRIVNIFAMNLGTADCYLQFFDAAAIPAEGETPDAVRPMPGKPADAQTGGILKEEAPVFDFTAGCQIVWSSTVATYTAIAAEDAVTKIVNGSYV